MSGRNLSDTLSRCVIVVAAANRGTHTYSPAAARRTYHSSERAAEWKYAPPDSRYSLRPRRLDTAPGQSPQIAGSSSAFRPVLDCLLDSPL